MMQLYIPNSNNAREKFVARAQQTKGFLTATLPSSCDIALLQNVTNQEDFL
jgi:hypothetical protein